MDLLESVELLTHKKKKKPNGNTTQHNTIELNFRSVLLYSCLGKTVLTQYISYQWAIGRLFKDQYDYVFCIPLRHLAREEYRNNDALTLEQLVFDVLLFQLKNDTLKDFSVSDIEEIFKNKREKILIILDGFDEIAAMIELPNIKEVFTEAFKAGSTLLTSRPYQLDALMDIQKFDRYLENRGFNNIQIQEYIEQYFVFDNTRQGAEDARNLVDWLKSSPQLCEYISLELFVRRTFVVGVRCCCVVVVLLCCCVVVLLCCCVAVLLCCCVVVLCCCYVHAKSKPIHS